MKILLINYEFPPLGGGTAIANGYLIKELSRFKNLQVDILTSSVDQFQQDSGLIRLNIGKRNRQLHHQSYLDLVNFFWHSTIWTLKHKSDYDLIHAFSGLPGSITAWLSGKPFMVSFRGADQPGYEPRHELFWKIFKPVMGFVYRRARSLDTNSQYLKNLVLKSWPDLKIKVIRNGVDTARFYTAKKQVTEPIILCTSRFGQRKGVEYLIRAMAQVPKAKLLLIGSGTLEAELKKLARELHLGRRVKFLGTLAHDQLPPFYRRAKLFVLPSLSESQSNSLLEALASGLPVVATNAGGNPELVDASNGILVPPANSRALAKAIQLAFKRRWPPAKKRKCYSWSLAAKKYHRIYLKNSSKIYHDKKDSGDRRGRVYRQSRY